MNRFNYPMDYVSWGSARSYRYDDWDDRNDDWDDDRYFTVNYNYYNYYPGYSEYYPNFYGYTSYYPVNDPYYYSYYPSYYDPYYGSDYYYSGYDPYFYGPYRMNTTYVYYGRTPWREMLLGAVLSAFLGDRVDNYFYAAPQYNTYYVPANWYSVSGYGYDPYDSYYYRQPSIYVSNTYYSTPDYSSYYDNYNGYYTPYGYTVDYYDPYSGDDYYSDDYYDDGNYPTYSYSSYNDDPAYTDELMRNAYEYGYEQGYQAGLEAANNDVSYYNDPYSYAGYDYDLYSATLTERRRCIGEGYDRGYQDALSGVEDPAVYGGGTSDLVGVFLNELVNFGSI